MTIEKGVDWGHRQPLPQEGPVADSNEGLFQHVQEHKRARRRPGPIGVTGGDLCRTVGGRGDIARLRSAEAMTLPIDLGSVTAAGTEHWFAAHLIARRSWMHGPVFAIMNAQWHRDWNLSPRGHPNDGRLVMFECTMTLTERLQAYRRLATGSHLPHPRISRSTITSAEVDLGAALNLYADGTLIGTARSIAVRVEPDAFDIVI